jgi:hypothetical protein
MRFRHYRLGHHPVRLPQRRRDSAKWAFDRYLFDYHLCDRHCCYGWGPMGRSCWDRSYWDRSYWDRSYWGNSGNSGKYWESGRGRRRADSSRPIGWDCCRLGCSIARVKTIARVNWSAMAKMIARVKTIARVNWSATARKTSHHYCGHHYCAPGPWASLGRACLSSSQTPGSNSIGPVVASIAVSRSWPPSLLNHHVATSHPAAISRIARTLQSRCC